MSRRMRRWVIGFGIVNVVLFLALVIVVLSRGPGGGGDTQQADPETPTAAESSASTAAPETETTPSAATESGEPTPTATFEVPEGALDLAQFQLPSRNIGCSLTQDAAECWIVDFSFTPPAGEDCQWRGSIITMTADGVAMPCPPSAPGNANDATPVLDYGLSTAVGQWLCTSTSSGLECSSLADGTGFTVARATFTSYGPGRLV